MVELTRKSLVGRHIHLLPSLGVPDDEAAVVMGGDDPVLCPPDHALELLLRDEGGDGAGGRSVPQQHQAPDVAYYQLVGLACGRVEWSLEQEAGLYLSQI